jgi:hypothetical protein
MLKLYTMPRLEIYFFTVYCLLFTFHFDVDPNPDSRFQIKAQNLEKVLK